MRVNIPKLIAVAVFSTIAFLAADAYVACLLTLDGQPIANLTRALQALPTYVSAHGPLSSGAGALATGTVAACGVWVVWAYSLLREGTYRTGEEHGSARWGTRRGGRRFMDTRHPDNNILLTEHYGLVLSRARHSRRYDRNCNVLVVGGSGSGKTRSYVEPNLMQLNSDYFVTDPKGTTLPNTGHMLSAAGYDIKVFNTLDMAASLHYNPLSYVRDEADILEFVECLITNTTGDREHSGDPFWEDAERLLYVALIGYLVRHCPRADRSISGLITLLSLAKAKENDESYLSPLDLLFQEIETGRAYVERVGAGAQTFDAFKRRSFDAGAASSFSWTVTGEPVAIEEDFCLLHYKMFKDAAGKTLKSILVSCNTRMEPFAIPQVRELVSVDEMELDRLGGTDGKRAVFAILSDTSTLYSFLLAIMMWQTMNLMCRKALSDHGGALPRPVHFMFDEFANIGRLPDMENMIAVVRSRNISMSLVLQSLNQLKSRYKDDAATIVDCCDTMLFLGGKSNETNKEISEAVGKQTVSMLTHNESRGTMSSSTRNWNRSERDLIQAAEVGKLDRTRAIVLIAGTDPLMDEKFDIERHRRWKQVYPGHAGALHDTPFDFSAYRETKRGDAR